MQGGVALGTWTQLDSIGTAIVVAPNGALFDLESNGQMWMLTTSWTQLDVGVTSIGMAADGTFVELLSTGALWKYTNAGWTRIPTASSLVTAFSIASNGYQLTATLQGGVQTTIGI
jgi:hypothetical protein